MALRRAAWVTVAVVLWLVVAFLLFAAVLGVVQLAGGRRHPGSGGVGGEIAAVIFFVVVAAGLGRLGLASEHRARGVRARSWTGLQVGPDAFGHPLASAQTLPGPAGGGAVEGGAPGPRVGRGGRWAAGRRRAGAAHHPISWLFDVLVFGFILVGLTRPRRPRA